VRPVRAADHLPPSSAAFMEEYSYTSTQPLGHTGPLKGKLYLFNFMKTLPFPLGMALSNFTQKKKSSLEVRILFPDRSNATLFEY